MSNKKKLSCELVLILALVCSCFCISLMLKSNLGITTLAVLPVVLHSIFPSISFGIWNVAFQILLLIGLMLIQRKWHMSYLISLAASIGFGKVIDWFSILLQHVPTALGFRIFYFVIAFFGICINIAFFLKCRLPVLPYDEFTRGIVEQFSWPVKYVKTVFDVLNLAVGIGLSLLVLHQIIGIGVGTIISAVFTGFFVNIFANQLNNRFEFVFTFPALARLER